MTPRTGADDPLVFHALEPAVADFLAVLVTIAVFVLLALVAKGADRL